MEHQGQRPRSEVRFFYQFFCAAYFHTFLALANRPKLPLFAYSRNEKQRTTLMYGSGRGLRLSPPFGGASQPLAQLTTPRFPTPLQDWAVPRHSGASRGMARRVAQNFSFLTPGWLPRGVPGGLRPPLNCCAPGAQPKKRLTPAGVQLGGSRGQRASTATGSGPAL